MMGTIIGARLGHCLFYEPDYYLANPLRILEIWKGGLASHGGTIGILVALALYARKNTDQPLGWLMDRLTVSVALTAACIRLGNFFNSEIVGKPTELPWAIVFERLDQIPRHPAMLYESVSYFVLCGVCFYLYATRIDTLKRGFLTGLLLVWIFTSRFLLEFVKENQVAFESGLPLNMGQLLSLPFVALGILFLLGKQAPFIDWMAPRPAGKKAAQHLPKAAKKSSKKKR
jgi:prolipoprotein diacylglyceryl transferase